MYLLAGLILPGSLRINHGNHAGSSAFPAMLWRSFPSIHAVVPRSCSVSSSRESLLRMLSRLSAHTALAVSLRVSSSVTTGAPRYAARAAYRLPSFSSTARLIATAAFGQHVSSSMQKARGHESFCDPCSIPPTRPLHPHFGEAWQAPDSSLPFSPPAGQP